MLLSTVVKAQVTVASRQPARHSVAVARNTNVTVSFSQAIAIRTTLNLKVYGALLGGKRPGSVAGGGTATLTFTPNQPFAPGELVSVSVPASLTSTGGATVAQQMFQFTAATGGTGRGFFLDTLIVGNTSNRDQALGDLDGDGDLDLVTTGSLFGCRVLLNTGAGKFIFKTSLFTGQTPSGLTLADVDQDGDLDLLAGDADNATVSVCLNDGTGSFIDAITGAQNAPVGRQPVSVAAGDLDSDGDLDFVAANAGSSSVTVWYNTGSLPLLFTKTSTIGIGSRPSAVALADIDNDGDLDLLTTHPGAAGTALGEVHISRNNGNGAFGGYNIVTVGSQPAELVLADLDSDGDQDLLTANTGAASVSVRLNNGSGGFTGTTTLALPAGSTPTGLRTGDLDADGDLDLAVAQGTGGRVVTFLNTAGVLAAQARPLRLRRDLASPTVSVGVVLGDVDGDLDLDLITSDGGGQVILSLNASVPPALPAPTISALTPATGPVGSTATVSGTNLTDVVGVYFNGLAATSFVLNGSGTALDATVPAGATTGLVTVVTDEAGTATSPTPFTIVVPVPVLLTGITPARNSRSADRTTNVAATFTVPITAATAGSLRVVGSLLQGRRRGGLTGAGTPTLTFDPTQDFAPGEVVSVTLPGSLRGTDGNAVARQVVQFTAAVGGTGRHDFFTTSTLNVASTYPGRVGDFDNDGDLDLAVPDYTVGVQLYINDGTGTFTNGPTLAGRALSLVVGDVDNDSDLDLVVQTNSGTYQLWLNAGNGAFAKGNTVPFTSTPQLTALADVDADGDLDLLSTYSSTLIVLVNDGSGGFGTPLYSSLNGAATDLALGDVDNDGDLDLVLCGSLVGGYQGIGVNLNDGSGSFSGAPFAPLYHYAYHLALGDVDNDGDLDLAVNTAYSNQVLILPNKGTGNFDLRAPLATLALAAPCLALADTDADGDLDLVSYAGVGLNDGSGAFPQLVTTTDAGINSPSWLALADMDADGDLDLLTNDQYNVVRIKLNRPGPPPTLTGLTPSSGAVGSSVLLTGINVQLTTGVTFNGVPAPSFTVLSATQVVATVPPGATTGAVVLQAAGGTAAAPGLFTVTQPLNVVALSPARHTVSAPRPVAISVRFSQPVAGTSAGELRVFGSRQGGRLAGTVTGAGTSTLTFTPTAPLAAGEAVSLVIPDRLASTTGSQAVHQVSQFTVATAGTGTGLLLPGVGRSLAAYGSRYGFAVGDIDGDGDPDVATTTGRVRYNNGEGAFPDSSLYSLFPGSNPRKVALADVDADGDLDLLSTNGHLYLNDGRGGLTEQPLLAGLSDDVRDLAVGDLDSDGDLDLLVPNYARDSVYALFNDGAGHFPVGLGTAVSRRPVGLALGDIDNDGDLDFVVTSEGITAASVSIGLNTGIGSFVVGPAAPAGPNGLTQLLLADLDGDHDLDLVTNNGSLFLNDGLGSFGSSQPVPAGNGVALGDLDADGDLDLVVATSGELDVRRNNGLAQFSGTERVSLGSTSVAHDPLLADLDGDGDLDGLVANATGYPVHVLLNQRLAVPTITSFAPEADLPGATVTITGTDLVGTTSISFGGVAAPDFTLVTASRIVVRVPAGARTGSLQVVNASGTATSATAFTVLEPVAISSFSPSPYATVPRTTAVLATFGQAMPTATAANLAVFSQRRGGLLAGSRSGMGSPTLSFTPAKAYDPGEQLSVSIPGYTLGNSRVAKRAFQFTAAVGGTGQGYFATPSAISSGSLATIMGDVDGDGWLDLLQADYNNVLLRRSTGPATYGPSTVILSYTNTSGSVGNMALGDVDGDGDLDLAVTDKLNNLVSICLNNGSGTFAGPTSVPVSDAPQRVALADLDADGDLDLLTVNSGYYAATLSVRYNDGNGKFDSNSGADTLIYPYGYDTVSQLRVADFDNDGDLDLFTTIGAGVGGIGSFLWLNDGLGHWTAAPATLRVPYGFFHVSEVGDVDGDGDLDVVFMGWGETAYSVSGFGNAWVSVNLNDGTGRFTATGFWAGRAMESVVLGDVDADNDLDMVLLAPNFLTGEVRLNNGQGNFSSVFQTFTIPYQYYRPQLLDLDSDGDLDLLQTYPYHQVLLNGLYPTPAITSFTPARGIEGTSVTITGVNFLDVKAVKFNGVSAVNYKVVSATQLIAKVPVGASTGRLTVHTLGGTATSATDFTVLTPVLLTGFVPGRNAIAAPRSQSISFTSNQAITTATAGNLRVFGNQLRGRRPGALTGGDTPTLTFDPAQDFAPGEQLSVSLPGTMLTATGGAVRPQVHQFTAAVGGTGRGSFKVGSEVAVMGYTYALVTGDLDNDGDLDLLTSDQDATGYGLRLLLNDGQATFTPSTYINTGSTQAVVYAELGDLDGDGDLDLVATTSGGNLTVCLNNGNATFAAAQPVRIPSARFALGDLDADGDLDLLALELSYGTLRTALNDGQGFLLPTTSSLLASNPVMVTLGDVDGDGDLDAVTASTVSGVHVYLNDGEGAFTEGSGVGTAYTVIGVALGDLDADGDLDIVAGYNDYNYSNAGLITMLNNGAGSFARGTPYQLAGQRLVQVQLADVDADADLDVLAVSSTSGNVLVRLNNGQGVWSGNQAVAVHYNPTRLAMGDFDGDGDLDFTTAQAVSGTCFIDIRLNQALALATTAAVPASLVTLYPNPAHGQFVLAVPASMRAAAATASPLRLYNGIGQLVLEQPMHLSANGEQTLDIAALPAGMYHLCLPLNGHISSYKLLVY
ncbi:FG-GAP-like repeat-containing protein [Hymenobacter setariae]|uniref:FG-GAP-like repeat-containing protein n=1 Tax=Hymenobacter setariae TaxID=2594794 RepID=UPI001F442D2D|nr:FG-GAP-like repeat-containing protein [Hymenobacter setariae]